jgi:tRNA A-37 threonylcarbamoyl transferase component Bud32/tetratricopeptide (TPR) repeat protein
MVQDGTPQANVTPEGWSRTKDLFLAALHYNGEARITFLDDNCSDDPVARGTVEAMLAAVDNGHSPLDVPAADRVLAKPGEPLQPGDVVGRYCILKRIGHGGTSVVYLAERTDMRTARQYAVKVLASAFMPLIRERFERECEILATLDHPNIVRILDKGVCGADWPCLVMDFIEGVPIQQYCRDRHLPPPEIARLFRECCGAVAHIHSNGVVHCDLKPNNILVDESGCPRILDFGIARLVEPEAQTTTGKTTRGARPLTPEYASPEQLLGYPLTPSTDIYSLGVVLYELLAGRTPFDSHERTWAQIAQEILEEDVPVPSKASGAQTGEQARPRNSIGQDLDSIVMKALARHPEKRYPSVSEFERDLSRYLAGLPVAARKPTFLYRATKTLARRRSFIGAFVCVLCLMALAIATTRWMDRREGALQAVRWASQSRDITRWLIASLFADLNAPAGRVEERRRLFRERIDLLEQSLVNSPSDPSLDLDVAEAYCRAGDLAGNPFQAHLGDSEAARRYYAIALQRAAPHAGGARADRAHFLRAEGYLGLGDLASDPVADNDVTQAAEYYQASLAEAAALDAAQLETRALRSILAHRLGVAYEESGQSEEAQRHYAEAAAQWPALEEASRLAPLLGNVAFDRRVRADASDPGQRIAAYRDILRDLKAAAAVESWPVQNALAILQMSLVAGAVELRDGRTEVAKTEFSAVIDITSELLRLDPENSQWHALRALALRRLARFGQSDGPPRRGNSPQKGNSDGPRGSLTNLGSDRLFSARRP